MNGSQRNDLTNWGQWGPADERGSLNLITPAMIIDTAHLIKTGQTYSLAAPLETNGPQWPPRQKIWQVTQYENDPAGAGWSGDALMMHSHSGTHMDALCHAWYHNQLYNGFIAAEHMSSEGSTRAGIDKVPCIVGRGILLDIAAWKGVDHRRYTAESPSAHGHRARSAPSSHAAISARQT